MQSYIARLEAVDNGCCDVAYGFDGKLCLDHRPVFVELVLQKRLLRHHRDELSSEGIETCGYDRKDARIKNIGPGSSSRGTSPSSSSSVSLRMFSSAILLTAQLSGASQAPFSSHHFALWLRLRLFGRPSGINVVCRRRRRRLLLINHALYMRHVRIEVP